MLQKILFCFAVVSVLSSCISEKEAKIMAEELSEKRVAAQALLEKGDFSTAALLSINDYYFEFSEKFFLLKSEEKTRKSFGKFIKKMGTKSFCQQFILKKQAREKLEEYCGKDFLYRCTVEMGEFNMILTEFKKWISTDKAHSVWKERDCS